MQNTSKNITRSNKNVEIVSRNNLSMEMYEPKTLTEPHKVKIRTCDGETHRGKINMNAESEPMERLSDFFLKGTNPFLVLYDISTRGFDKVIIINKTQIVWVAPDD